MNPVTILWLRQVKRYIRSKPRIIGSLGQPLLFLLAFGFGFGPMYKQAKGGDYIQFLAPGLVAMSVLFTSIFSGIEIIWDRRFGFLKETLVAPVSRLAIMAGRTLGGATVSLFQGFIVLGICALAGARPSGWLWIPEALLFMSLISLFFAGFGTALASLLEDMQGFQLIMNFLIMPVFFLSGALFPMEGLPPAMAWLMRADPLTYGVDGLRGAMTGVYHLGMATDLAVLAGLTALALAAGAALFERIEA
jgi:ABC-2 type transport system permease protein